MVPSTGSRFFHGTLEAFFFHATSYTPTCPFNVSIPCIKHTILTVYYNVHTFVAYSKGSGCFPERGRPM